MVSLDPGQIVTSSNSGIIRELLREYKWDAASLIEKWS
jgi:hypothetical protein